MAVSLRVDGGWRSSFLPHRSSVGLGARVCSFRAGFVHSSQAKLSIAQQRRQILRPTVAKLPDVTEADFDQEVLKSSVPVIVDFWANWCGPCRLIVPVLESAAKELGEKVKIVKVEVDSNPKLVEKYKVYGLPTVVLFENGDLVPGGHFEGALTKAKLQELLKEKLPAVVA